MSAASLMLKSDRENKESKYVRFSVVPLPVVIPSLFIEEDDGSLFMDSG